VPALPHQPRKTSTLATTLTLLNAASSRQTTAAIEPTQCT